MKRRVVGSALSVLALLLAPGAAERAFAGGFQLYDQSPSGEADAFAGAAAVAEDPSTIFANPAGMTYLNGFQTQAGVNIIITDGTFSPSVAKTTPTPFNGFTSTGLTGQGNRDFGEAEAVPHIYAALPLTAIADGLWAGLGVTAPFGLVTDYGSNTWIGRYYAEHTELTTINATPSLAYKFANWLSLGAGVDILYGDALLKQAVDFGSICTNAAGAGTCGLFGLAPQANDGQVKFSGDDTTVGWNLGAMLQPLDQLRIGLAYRSGFDVRLKGTASFSVPTAFRTLQATVPAFAGTFVNTSASAKLPLPGTANLSFAEQATSKWTVLADVSWTQWSRFQNFTITFANPAQPAQVTTEKWHDTVRESLGAIYAASDRAKLRFGIAWDPTPVSTANRTLNIPDDSRIWTSIGYNVRLMDNLSFDAAYSHLWVPGNSKINLSTANQGTIAGTFASSVDIVTLGLKYTF